MRRKEESECTKYRRDEGIVGSGIGDLVSLFFDRSISECEVCEEQTGTELSAVIKDLLAR
ncbi:uncharacterized protein N7482_001402 [Penicillium canariense]|uniref:Uncharacterized protein n=1 Tax=Penicillium canariense TaxID=189055 RepID=A0A9W9IGK1_9EURO|nr:uncharacterized protein N7482_001402 [Penicillium canariense]KAJ5175525.1 hypothetical protein N7482_001402 [Penicillium canariense]